MELRIIRVTEETGERGDEGITLDKDDGKKKSSREFERPPTVNDLKKKSLHRKL